MANDTCNATIEGLAAANFVKVAGLNLPPWGFVLLGSGLGSVGLIGLHRLLRPVYSSVARSLLRRAGATQEAKQSSNIVKQQRELLCYAVLVAVGWTCTPWHGWIIDQASLWTSFTVPLNIGVYYALQLSMYLHLMVMDVLDRSELQGPDPMGALDWIHHIVCLILATGTLLPGYVRPGAITFLLHDPSSLALKCARVFYLAEWTGIAKTAFKVFALLFFVLRICAYPALFFSSAVFYSVGRVPDFARWSLGSLLVLLIAMNCVFMYKIVAVARRGDAKKPSDCVAGDTAALSKPLVQD